MSLLTTTTGVTAILPTQESNLIIAPVQARSLAFDPSCTTVMNISGDHHNLRIPIVKSDVSASWVDEGEEIVPDDPEIDELVISPAKVAALTVISRELADDSEPAAANIVGESIARDLAVKVDAAWIGDLAAPAPAGLESVTPTDTVVAATITNLDPFAEAISEAEQVGATVTSWIMNPATALTLAKIKGATGSNAALMEDPRVVFGRPVKVHADVPAGVVYGVDKSRCYTVLRSRAEIHVSDQAYFSSDRVAIRGILRVGFGFTPGALVTIAPTEPATP